MAFVKAEVLRDNSVIELVVFSSAYQRYSNLFDMSDHEFLRVSAKKTDKTKAILNKAHETVVI
jgi:hypothetical protein